MRPSKSYLICSVRRSGGGLLAGLLTNTGVAGRPEEYFWRDDEAFWRSRWGMGNEPGYVRRALSEGSTPNGVFGARIMWGYVEEICARLAEEEGLGPTAPSAAFDAVFPNVRYVQLVRLDRLAQAVSWAKSEQTNEWFAGDARKLGAAPEYDHDVIESLLGTIAEWEGAWHRFFGENGIQPLPVAYEGLVHDPEDSTKKVLDFLEIPSDGVPIQVRTQRQADSINDAWIVRYRSETGC